MSRQTMEAMVWWVEQHLDAEPTLEALSGYVGYSPFYCSAKFHEFTGKSFRGYVWDERLARSAQELLTTDARLLDIAVKYGFSSHEAFTRAFCRRYGCSPKEYRQNHPKPRKKPSC